MGSGFDVTMARAWLTAAREVSLPSRATRVDGVTLKPQAWEAADLATTAEPMRPAQKKKARASRETRASRFEAA